MKQLGRLRDIQVVDGEKIGPLIVKCKCGAYRHIEIDGNRFIVEGCPMYGLPHHHEKDWAALGTGEKFDFENIDERNNQTVEW